MAAVQAGLALDPSFTMRRLRKNVPSDHLAFLAMRERVYAKSVSTAAVPGTSLQIACAPRSATRAPPATGSTTLASGLAGRLSTVFTPPNNDSAGSAR